MKKLSITAIAVWIFVIGFLSLCGGISRAADTSGDNTSEVSNDVGDMDYSYGKVVSISGKDIVVKEYDYEKDQEIDVIYDLTHKVELQNLESLKDVKPGDEVEIYYDSQGGKKEAMVISRPEIEDDVSEPEEEPAAVGNVQQSIETPVLDSDVAEGANGDIESLPKDQ